MSPLEFSRKLLDIWGGRLVKIRKIKRSPKLKIQTKPSQTDLPGSPRTRLANAHSVESRPAPVEAPTKVGLSLSPGLAIEPESFATTNQFELPLAANEVPRLQALQVENEIPASGRSTDAVNEASIQTPMIEPQVYQVQACQEMSHTGSLAEPTFVESNTGNDLPLSGSLAESAGDNQS